MLGNFITLMKPYEDRSTTFCSYHCHPKINCVKNEVERKTLRNLKRVVMNTNFTYMSPEKSRTNSLSLLLAPKVYIWVKLFSVSL